MEYYALEAAALLLNFSAMITPAFLSLSRVVGQALMLAVAVGATINMLLVELQAQDVQERSDDPWAGTKHVFWKGFVPFLMLLGFVVVLMNINGNLLLDASNALCGLEKSCTLQDLATSFKSVRP